MKNLKGVLFVGLAALAFAPAVAFAETYDNDNATSGFTAKDATNTLTLTSNITNGGTINVPDGKTLNITGSKTLTAKFTGEGTIVVANGTNISGTFGIKKINKAGDEGTGAIKFTAGQSVTLDKDATINKVAAAGQVIYSNDNVVEDSTSTREFASLDAFDADKLDEMYYLNTTAGDVKFAIPAAFSKYAAVKEVANADGKNSKDDDKKTVWFDEGLTASNIKVTYYTGVADTTQVVNVTAVAAKAQDTKNDAVAKAIVDDYLAAMKKNSTNPSFATRGLTKDTDMTKPFVVGATDNSWSTNKANINADIKKYADANGYKILGSFEATAKIGETVLTELPAEATLTVDAGGVIEVPTAEEGKVVKVVVLNLHGYSVAVVDDTVEFNANNKKFTFSTKTLSPMALAYKIEDKATTPAAEEPKQETNTGDATKEANPKTSDNVMTSVVSLLVSAFGLTAAGLKLKNN